MEDARLYFEQKLKIRHKVLGKGYPDTANSLNNLGRLPHVMSDLEDTRQYYEDAL